MVSSSTGLCSVCVSSGELGPLTTMFFFRCGRDVDCDKQGIISDVNMP